MEIRKSDWIQKIWSAIYSFPSGFGVAIALVSFLIMGPEDMYNWAVKSQVAKEELLRRAFSNDKAALSSYKERLNETNLQMVDIKSELNSIRNENTLLRESNSDLRGALTDLRISMGGKDSDINAVQALLDREKELHSATKQSLLESKHNSASYEAKLNDAMSKLRIPDGHTVGDDGTVRDKNGRKVCKEIVVEPTQKVASGNMSSTTVGKYRTDCLMSNGEWLPAQR